MLLRPQLSFVTILAWFAVSAHYVYAMKPTCVAVVNGQQIQKSQVAVEPHVVIVNFYRMYNRVPAPGVSDDPTLQQLAHKLEIEKLGKLINQDVRMHLITSLGLSATPPELQAASDAFKKQTSERSFYQAVKEGAKNNLGLLDALDAVYDKNESPDKVFESIASPKMSRSMWQFLLVADKSKAFRAKRRKQVEYNLHHITYEQMLQPGNFRITVEQQNLDSKIDSDLSIQDPHYAEIIGNIKDQGGAPMADMSYVSAARRKWWSQQYQKASIQILDDSYDDVYRYLGIDKSASDQKQSD